MKAPAYQHYAQDWLVGTAAMTLEAQGAYQRLLDHQWVDGPLPDDLGKLQRLVGTDTETFRRLWVEIEEKFPVVEGRRVNPRLEAERQKQADYRERQAEKGRLGGRTRVAKPDPLPGLKPDKSSSVFSLQSSELTDSSNPSGAPVNDLALRMAQTANQALKNNPRCHIGELQVRPLQAARATQCAEDWTREGIPPEVILAGIETVCAAFRPTKENPRIGSFRYFEAGVHKAWAESKQGAQLDDAFAGLE